MTKEKENKIKGRLNKFTQELNEVRVNENTLIQECITLLQNGESEKGAKLLSFDNTSEIINRLFDLAQNLRKDILSMVEE